MASNVQDPINLGDSSKNAPNGTSNHPPKRRKKRRWGDAPPPSDTGASANAAPNASGLKISATANAPNATETSSTSNTSSAADPRARAAALQASIQARLAALKSRAAPSTNSTAPPSTTTSDEASISTRKRPKEGNKDEDRKSVTKRARVFELDMSVTAPTRLLEKQKRDEEVRSGGKEEVKINPYLAHTVDASDGDAESGTNSGTTLLDSRLAGGHVAKTRLRHRPINFVTPGTYIALGEKKRQAAARAEESGYVSGRKDGRVIQSVGMGGATDGGKGYYGVGEAGQGESQLLPPRADAPEIDTENIGGKQFKITLASMSEEDAQRASVEAAILAAESSMPYAMEWWDAELLPSKLRKELASEEGKAIASRARKGALQTKPQNESDDTLPEKRQRHQKIIERCYKLASLTHSRTHTLLQHPVPILTPAQRASANTPKAPTLHLTKAERKRHRKLRRAERLREQQDMQAAGLVPPPEPRLTLSNYMRVLGDQAVLDPSRMEARVMEQIQARKLKHEQMNAERKLTKEQKAEKHARKLHEDTSLSVSVALFWVKDMSHPYHRAKVDLNAQQNGITGGVLECAAPKNVVLIVAEGGEKAIKRYIRLMTVRMRWKGEEFYSDDEDDDDDNNNIDENLQQDKDTQERKKFNPNNECELIWTGMAVKRAFHSFMFQSAANITVARKILEAKSVAHYWDLALSHAERKENHGHDVMDGALRFRLGDGGT